MKQRKPNAKKRTSLSTKETNEFNLGYFYRTIEEHLEAFAAQEGCPYSLTDVAFRLGERLTDKAIRQQPGSAELVPQVRQDGTRSRLQRSIESDKTIHVRSRVGRTLNPAERKKHRKPYVLTPARLRAMRANVVKARAARARARKAA